MSPGTARPDVRVPLPQGKRMGSLLLVALATGCAPPPDASTLAPAGCYQFRRDAGARALGLPWGVELLSEPLESAWPVSQAPGGAWRALTATSAADRADHPFGYWRWTPADSVEMGHPGGGGFTLTLAFDGQDLVGRGRPVGDAVAPGQPFGVRPSEPVAALRVVCGAT